MLGMLADNLGESPSHFQVHNYQYSGCNPSQGLKEYYARNVCHLKFKLLFTVTVCAAWFELGLFDI